MGDIACGEPIFANEEYGSFISTTDDLDVDFCLRAVGDSMIGARIYDGDIVFVRKQSTVDNGEIAAVLIDDEATLKRVYYYPDKNKLVLSPENPKYEPFVYIGEELSEVRILGKARRIPKRNTINQKKLREGSHAEIQGIHLKSPCGDRHRCPPDRSGQCSRRTYRFAGRAQQPERVSLSSRIPGTPA